MLNWRSLCILSHVKTLRKHVLSRGLCTQVLHGREQEVLFPPCGQPTPTSHPHLLKPGELIPGFKTEEFVQRRHLLMKIIQTKSHTQGLYNIIVIPSASKIYMTDKIPFVFRQNTDFFYFTGCLEPDSVLVIHGENDDNFSSELFVRNKDSKAELWDGLRTGLEVAPKLFSVDKAHTTEDLSYFLQSLSVKNPNFCLWYDNAGNEKTNSALKHILSNSGKSSYTVKPYVHQLRLYKSDSEQEMMRRTCRIASEAFVQTIGFTKPQRTEHELLAKFENEVKMSGAQILAYPPVIASGNNANIIHYIDNNQMCQSGEMVLMDAGCELNGYDSDITRTWPVSGKFSDEQRVLYEIVLHSQEQLIKLCDSLPSLDEVFGAMCNLLGQSLVSNHIVTKSYAALNSHGTIGFKFCPHHSSHYLGMDVHDCATISRTVPVAPGMIFTVEPGVYIPLHCEEVRQEFRGLGIRIEDDVLIDNAGSVENLTKMCPKRVEDIENICVKNTGNTR